MGKHTSSIDRPSPATRFSVPSMTFFLERSHGPHSHSFSRTLTTSFSIGGLWQYWWYAVLHTSQKTMRLLPGSVPRWHILHCAARIVLVDLRRLTPGVGSGSVGTNATGLFTLRPDFVRVGSGVYEDEMSESSSCAMLAECFFTTPVCRHSHHSPPRSPIASSYLPCCRHAHARAPCLCRTRAQTTAQATCSLRRLPSSMCSESQLFRHPSCFPCLLQAAAA